MSSRSARKRHSRPTFFAHTRPDPAIRTSVSGCRSSTPAASRALSSRGSSGGKWGRSRSASLRVVASSSERRSTSASVASLGAASPLADVWALVAIPARARATRARSYAVVRAEPNGAGQVGAGALRRYNRDRRPNQTNQSNQDRCILARARQSRRRQVTQSVPRSASCAAQLGEEPRRRNVAL
jgi:hypothetical protein